MFKKQLEIIFITVIVLASSLLVYNHYKTYSFLHNPLPKSYIRQIHAKEEEVLGRMQENFGVRYKFPIIITDKLPNKFYGLTTYKNGVIKIYLNKKTMQESFNYMLDDVIPHEYAHAFLFKIGHNSNYNGGHTKEWRETCIKLGGKGCRRYVNEHEVVMSKLAL